jgi:hypothetical protein
MISREKLVSRLLNEWIKHGKIIIACDFDDTIRPWKDFSTAEDSEEVMASLRNACSLGATIVINTATTPNRYPQILSYCEQKNLVVEPEINKNPVELPYGNHGKVYANIFIDDRAGLTEALEILDEAARRLRHTIETKNHE